MSNTYMEKWGDLADTKLSVRGLLDSSCDLWCARTDSNRQPSDPKSDALSIELRTLVHYILVVHGESDYGRIS